MGHGPQAKSGVLAGEYGAKQTDLGVVMGVTRQRIGQLFDETDVTGLTQRAVEAQIDQVEGWPGDAMSALAALAHGGANDDAEHRQRLYQQTEVAYGRETADERHQRRSAFLELLSTDTAAAALVAEQMERARRTVTGRHSPL